IRVPGGGYLNKLGLFLPGLQLGGAGPMIFSAFLIAIAGAVAVTLPAGRRRVGARTAAAIGLVLVLGLPIRPFLASRASPRSDSAQMRPFTVRGALEIQPGRVALLAGLVISAAAFIAETVRAGIRAVPRGQSEAALALGLSRLTTLRRVIGPQAMRVIIPPLTSQYLNLTKNSSLAVAIGYPDLVQIFTGTVLNQTSQAVEIVGVTMAVYLAISLLPALLMNLYNARRALAER